VSPSTRALATRAMTFVRPAISTAGLTYIGMALSLVSTPLLASELGAEGRGVLAASFVSVQLIGWMGFLGLPRGVAVQSQRLGAPGRASILWLTVCGFGSTAICFATADLVANGDERIAAGIRVASIVLIATGVGQLGIERVLAEGKLRLWNFARAGILVVPSLAFIVAFVFGGLSPELAFTAMLGGQVLTTLIGCAFAIPLIRRATSQSSPWKFSLHIWSVSAFDSVGGRLDQLLLAALASPSMLGTYVVSVTLASASGAATQALNHVSYSRFLQASDDSRTVQLRQRSLFGLIVSALAGTVVVFFVAVLGERFLGSDFNGLVTTTAALIVFQALNDQWQLRVYYDSAAEEARHLTYSSGIALAAMVVCVVGLELTDNLNSMSMAVTMIFFGVVRLGARSIFKRGGAEADSSSA
jgi:O-antigen/teichoic acid export membrane protein